MIDDAQIYYFDIDNWEFTTSDKSLVLDDMGCNEIRRIGVLSRQPDVYVAQRYNESEDEYETKEFASLEEATAWKRQ